MANSSFSGTLGPAGATGPTGPVGATGATGATGAGGGSISLISDQLLTVTASSIAFTSIAGYKHLKLFFVGRTSNGSDEDQLLMQFNSDTTAAHYFTQRNLSSGSTTTSSEHLGTLAGYAMIVSGGAGAGLYGWAELDILNYADATYTNKTCFGTGFVPSGTGTGKLDTARFGLYWNVSISNAITRIDLKPGVGALWDVGTRATLYGLS